MKTLFINIKQLLQVRSSAVEKLSGAEMQHLPCIDNAFLIIENDRIYDFGLMANSPINFKGKTIDLKGKLVLPSWCDSHTHLVFAKPRSQEFIDRINGLTYEEIAEKGGGILNSAKALNLLSEEELLIDAKRRLDEVVNLGTGAIEIKSGYGLDIANEIKMLRVIKELSKVSKIPIKATLLAAHALPTEFKNKKSDYIDLIINELIPTVCNENLAEYIDVFCEKGYFSVSETNQILRCGIKHGLIPKVHVNQFNILGGVEAAVNHNALSVDHLELLDKNDLKVLKNSNTICTALPACSFFLSIPYAPVKQMIANDLAVALASDFNPGSSPTHNMNFIVSLACIKMKMTPEEAINAATINGAYAMGLSKDYGSITKGKKANLIITKSLNHYNEIPYYFGSNLIDFVMINGK